MTGRGGGLSRGNTRTMDQNLVKAHFTHVNYCICPGAEKALTWIVQSIKEVEPCKRKTWGTSLKTVDQPTVDIGNRSADQKVLSFIVEAHVFMCCKACAALFCLVPMATLTDTPQCFEAWVTRTSKLLPPTERAEANPFYPGGNGTPSLLLWSSGLHDRSPSVVQHAPHQRYLPHCQVAAIGPLKKGPTTPWSSCKNECINCNPEVD